MWVLIAGVILLCFSFVLIVGPPYLPTMNRQVEAALDMLDLKPGQTMLELGCGDGKVLVAAARRGWMVIGVELNPLLVLVCKLRTWRYRKLVRVRMGNYWDTGLWGDDTVAIFGFVLPKYMTKLDRTIKAWQRRPVRLASFAFTIPGRQADDERDGVFLYLYPYKIIRR